MFDLTSEMLGCPWMHAILHVSSRKDRQVAQQYITITKVRLEILYKCSVLISQIHYHPSIK